MSDHFPYIEPLNYVVTVCGNTILSSYQSSLNNQVTVQKPRVRIWNWENPRFFHLEDLLQRKYALFAILMVTQKMHTQQIWTKAITLITYILMPDMLNVIRPLRLCLEVSKHKKRIYKYSHFTLNLFPSLFHCCVQYALHSLHYFFGEF